jgi:hypothetical protein
MLTKLSGSPSIPHFHEILAAERSSFFTDISAKGSYDAL